MTICDTCGRKGRRVTGNVETCSRYERRAETNWERWFGTPEKAAESVGRLVDLYDAISRDENYSSPFTDNFKLGGSCEFGLIHNDTLENWLESEVDE